MRRPSTRRFLSVLALAVPLLAAPVPLGADANRATTLGEWVVLAWNDLGMHCMNQYHHVLSVLPPYNNLRAQVIRRGDATRRPQVVTAGVTVEYSVPGNTWSVGKTDFWTYAPALFGVVLPPDVGLTGKGLTGSLDLSGTHFGADGIPVTPFTDAAPTVEAPYQNALVIARGAGGAELARSTPTIPVSVDLSCVSGGCHASEQAIVNRHPRVTGFDPAATPILCGRCHADPALGTPGVGDAGYFSFRMHDHHKFIDQEIPGIAGCYKCHPGSSPKCLRGTMATDHGMICQDCHGGMAQVAGSIEAGRVPWVDEPRCGTCHAAQYAEEPGTLFKLSLGHGGVACEGCHNSTHAEVPSREAADDANNVALQGYAGPLRDCTVCHGVAPVGAGPHGLTVAGAPGDDLLSGARAMRVSPNPARGACSIEFAARTAVGGVLMVHDLAGRVVRRLEPVTAGADRLRARWDGRDRDGRSVEPGTYYVRWVQGADRAGARVTLVR